MDASTAATLLDMAESARAEMRDARKAEAVARLEDRSADLAAALDWFLAEGDPDRAFRLASALVPYWMATGRIDVGDRWFAGALTTGATRPARALYDHGYLVFWAGRYDLATERFDEARSQAAASGDPTVVALSLAGSARVALDRDPAEAVRLLREALGAIDGTDDTEGRSSVMHVLGVALQMSGDLEGARAVMEDRRSLAREQGDTFVAWVETANLSMVERQLGDIDRAEALSREALAMIRDGGDELAIAWTLNGLAASTAAIGEHERAATLLGLAESLLQRAGGEWPPDERSQYDATRATLGEALDPDTFVDRRALGASMTTARGLAYALDDPAR